MKCRWHTAAMHCTLSKMSRCIVNFADAALTEKGTDRMKTAGLNNWLKHGKSPLLDSQICPRWGKIQWYSYHIITFNKTMKLPLLTAHLLNQCPWPTTQKYRRLSVLQSSFIPRKHTKKVVTIFLGWGGGVKCWYSYGRRRFKPIFENMSNHQIRKVS